jgi:hypothetical protein
MRWIKGLGVARRAAQAHADVIEARLTLVPIPGINRTKQEHIPICEG